MVRVSFRLRVSPIFWVKGGYYLQFNFSGRHYVDDKTQQALSDEATSLEYVLVPRANYRSPITDEPNWWRVEVQYHVYKDSKMLNDKVVMIRLVTLELRILTRSLHTVTKVHRLFNLHKFDWMAQDLGSYNEDIVREFNVSYIDTL